MGQTLTDRKALNRSWVVRVGKTLRKKLNPWLRANSTVGDAPVFDASLFDWTAMLAENWRDIRHEALYIATFREAVPPLSDISPDHAKLDTDRKWRSYFLYGYGYRSDANCARCPKTVALLDRIPNLRTALFSMHEPGMVIAPHTGVTAGVLVYHLGLEVPDDPANCAIKVADQIIPWTEGEAFIFDDTYKHETWNRTDGRRIILLLHVERPLRFPASLVSKLFLSAIKWSPFVRDARANMVAWDKRFQAMEAANDSQIGRLKGDVNTKMKA